MPDLPQLGLPIEAATPDLITAMAQRGRAVLHAPPGSGKTTFVPLALDHAGLFDGKIIMLEPRRLAARAAAQRLAQNDGSELGTRIGYAMRGDRKRGTDIEVVTEGVLTRMIQSDPELSGIGCIIFDEFHERSIHADLGLALCLEIADSLRPDLGLLVMSATLDGAQVAKLMGDAPVIEAQGRSFPVTEHFLALPWQHPERHGDHFTQAMASLIFEAYSEHDGSVLAFLPGEREIRNVAARFELDGLNVLPLYGRMDFSAQRAAIAPSKTRKIVLATSIAETSLTIEGIEVVVDSGLARRAVFNRASGMSRLVTERVTRAEAIQRAGRAGRLGPGHCYKLWTKGENGGMKPFPEPEILRSDITSLALELAMWGSTELPFLTPPRDTDLQAANTVLRALGALDDNGRITPKGQDLHQMPTNPRLANLLSQARNSETLAVLLERGDILRDEVGSVDMALRIDALFDTKRLPRAVVKPIFAEIKRLRATGKRSLSLGQMAALAYPDRIGKARKGQAGQYLLSNGTGAQIMKIDPLAKAEMIVALDLDGRGATPGLRLAAEITADELQTLYPDQITQARVCYWDAPAKRVVAEAQTRFGALVLKSSAWADCPQEMRIAALIEGLQDTGLHVLKLSKPATLFAARADQMGLIDFSDTALLDSAGEWLAPFMGHARQLPDLAKIDHLAALKARLDWGDLQKLERLFPEKFTAPTGSNVRIDYEGEQPKIAIRLQELFGLATHPTIGPKKTPLLIELLSPAQRPVQLTSDLPAFWKNSYADVRKDMRGRYPKHYWPENPLEAEATRRAKPRK